MNNYKDNFSNPMIQKLIIKAESEKRSAFLAGAAWAFQVLDEKHPNWNLQSLVPPLLKELSDKCIAEDAQQPLITSPIITTTTTTPTKNNPTNT